MQFLWKPFVNLEFFADFSSSGVFCINDYPVPHNPDVSGEGAVGGEPRSFYKWEILSLSLSIICIIGINSLQIDASRIFCFYIIQSYRYQIIEKIGIHIDEMDAIHIVFYIGFLSRNFYISALLLNLIYSIFSGETGPPIPVPIWF